MRRFSLLPWLPLLITALYLLVPLYATLDFSLQAKKGELGFTAYVNVLQSEDFVNSFLFSLQTALLTITISIALIVPTAYWVRLKMAWLRPVVEFFTLLPLVI